MKLNDLSYNDFRYFVVIQKYYIQRLETDKSVLTVISFFCFLFETLTPMEHRPIHKRLDGGFKFDF